MLDILTIGDIKLDTFAVLHNGSVQCSYNKKSCQLCVEHGAKVLMDVIESQMAGSAPNVAVALARLGKKSAVLSNMGKDLTLDLARTQLKKEGVSDQYIRVLPKAQSSYSFVLNFEDERTIFTSHIKNVYTLPKKLPKSKWVFLSEMGPQYKTFFRSVTSWIQTSDMLVGFNPGSAQIQEKSKELFSLIKQTDVLFVNVEEAQALLETRSQKIQTLMDGFSEMGVPVTVITDGKAGAYAYDNTRLLHAPMFPGKRVEATGAGDSFAAGFIGALLHQKTIEDGLAWGSVNAASVVQHVGPQPGLLTKARILRELRLRPSYSIKTL